MGKRALCSRGSSVLRSLSSRSPVKCIDRFILLLPLILLSPTPSAYSGSPEPSVCQYNFETHWVQDSSGGSYLWIKDKKSLKRRYHFQRKQLIESDIPKRELELLDLVFINPDLIPNGNFLINRGSMAADFDVEIALTKEFVDQYHAWKKKLQTKGNFKDRNLKDIDLNVFTRAILIEGNFNLKEIFNLSLIYDDLYGSHLFEYDRAIEIRNISHFLSVRRQLALIQSTFIAGFFWEKIQKKTDKIPVATRESNSRKPVLLKKEWRVRFVEGLAQATTWLIPPLKKIVSAIFKAIEPATPVDPIGTNIAKHYLEKPWMPKLLNDFRKKLLKIDSELSQPSFDLNILDLNVFDVALGVSNGNHERALVIVGLMSIQRKALIRNLARHYKDAGTFDRYAQALIDTVAIYYFITDIAETIDQIRVTKTRRYTFLYPEGYRGIINNKFYHFWSEAFFAVHLRKQGFSKFWVRFALKNVGRIYEFATSIAGIRFFKAYGMNTWEAFLSTKMLEDIELHKNGVEFGVNLFESMAKSNSSR